MNLKEFQEIVRENEGKIKIYTIEQMDEKELKENRIITAIEELERVDSLLKGCKHYPKAKKSLYDLLHEVRGY